MISTVEYAELRTTLPGEAGIECTFYERLNARLFDLREGLYVTVEADGHDFRPGWLEHFPKGELVSYQACALGAVGKGGPLEVVFRFYSPPGKGLAEEGARIVADALEGLEERLGASEWSRTMAAGVDGMRVARKLVRMGLSGDASLPYRPPPGDLPTRKRAPLPKTTVARPPDVPSIGEQINRMFRGELARWGALEDYDRLRTSGTRRPAPSAEATRTLEQWQRWREMDERMKAAQRDPYANTTGGRT